MATLFYAFTCLLVHNYAAVHSSTIYNARLSGGSSGAVEVLTRQGWLPLCNSSKYTVLWRSSIESKILCQQLGYIYHNGVASKGLYALFHIAAIDIIPSPYTDLIYR